MTADARTARLRAALLLGVAAMSLVGCVADEPDPEPSAPATSAAPDEPTDEGLLAEAREVYEGYLAASTAMWELPRPDYTTLTPWASDEISSEESAAHTSLRAEGVVAIGPMTVKAFIAENPVTAGDDLRVFACIDFRQARHLNTAGEDVTPQGSVEFAPLVVQFEREADRLLLVSQEALPEGVESPCA